jgi:RNA polymerase sigma factor (sigma-70 family)
MPKNAVDVLLRELRTFIAGRKAEGQTDRCLVEQFLSHRDEASFGALLERHGPMVLGVCRRVLRDEHSAEDAFQATFLILVRQAGTIRKRQSVGSWLHGVALRLALKLKAAGTRSTHADSRCKSHAGVDPQAEATWHESREILDNELQRLPESYRLPLVLCYLEGLTRDEAAAQLGWTVGKLKGLLDRGRDRLRSRLIQRGVTLSAAASATLLADTILAAAVPPLLTVTTIRAAARFAGGVTLAACGISAPVVALTEGGLKMMAAKKTSVLLALVLFTAMIGSGVGIFAQRTELVEAKQPNEPPALAVSQEPPKNDEQKKERVDRHGDPLPPGAIARLGTVRFRAPDEADALAFAPDAKTVAVSSRAGLFLFAADSGKRIKRLADNAFAGRSGENMIAFSTDGKCLASWQPAGPSRSKDGVRVWELTREQKPQDYDAEHPIWLGWTSDSAPLAACLEKGAVSLRELAAGRSRRFKCENLRQPDFSNYVLCSCAPGGKALAVADEKNTIHVWDTTNGDERCTVSPNQDDILRGLTLSPDGRHLATWQQGRAAPYENAVHIWDALTGKALRTIAVDHKYMSTLVFAPDGKTLATAGGNGIRCWEVATGRERSRSEGEGANTLKIAFTGDGQTLATLQTHSGAFHLWHVATGKRQAEPAGHTSRPHGTSFSPDGRRLATGGGLDGTIHIWDLATSNSLFNIRRSEWIRDAVFSRDGRSIFSTWTGDTLWISDAATGKRQHVIKLEDPERPDTTQSAISMHLSADGAKLVAFSYYYLKKGGGGPMYNETLITGWDPVTRKQLFRRRLPGQNENAVSADTRQLAAAYPSSRLELGLGRGPMRLEDLATGKLILDFPELEGQTSPLAFSPDGRLLASWNSNYERRKEGDPTKTGSNLVLWEVATAAEVLSVPLAGQFRVAFSPDGRLLALTAPTRDIVVWDLAQGRELRRFKDLDAEVTWLGFAPDSQRLVSGLADSTLLIWDVAVPLKEGKLTADDMAKAWDDLAGADAPRAFRAQGSLASVPEATLALFQKQLKPVRPADPRRLQKLINDLESQQFSVRNAANKELEELGGLAAGALRQAQAKNSSLEMRRRIETLLDKLSGTVTRPELLRAVRAVAVLENIASPDARKLLENLLQGDPDARLTQEATGALKRLDQKSRPK